MVKYRGYAVARPRMLRWVSSIPKRIGMRVPPSRSSL